MDSVAPLLAWRRRKAGEVRHTLERVELPETAMRRIAALEAQVAALVAAIGAAATGQTSGKAATGQTP